MAGHKNLRELYEYQSLPADDWIRILLLHPGPGPLACTISSESIKDAALHFEALSYVWGSNAHIDTFEINCNGRLLVIGSNLRSALLRIRHATKARQLWVDAVCINQKDEDEKSQQVKQMGEIYASAERVLIWIGEDLADEAEECFALIRETNGYLMEQLAKCKDVTELPFIAHGNGSICADPRKWDTVRHLMNSEWFTRVWVLQEVGLARSALILWGKSSMNWSQLVELMLFVAWRADVGAHTGNVKSGTIYDVYEDVWRSFENKDTWRDELPLTRSMNKTLAGQTLLDILNDGRVFEATDQRDRIYAFLSHPRASSHAKKKAAVVDYRKSVEEVYSETARHILDYDPHPWTVLSCIDHIPDSPSLSGQRSSWVPRWDEGFRVYWLGYSSMWYRAGGDQPAVFHAEVKSNGCLKTRAILLDTIDWRSKAFLQEELVLSQQRAARPLQAVWQHIEQSTQRDPSTVYGANSKDREHAYSLVVVAGRDSDDGPAHENPMLHRSVYQAYQDLLFSHAPGNEEPVSNEAEVPESDPHHLQALTYLSNQRRALHNRRIFRTSKGYYGVGHRTIEVGDICCVIRGANVPFVLRKAQLEPDHSIQTSEKSYAYKLVGEAYIQGVMNGEALVASKGEMRSNSSTSGGCMASEVDIVLI